MLTNVSIHSRQRRRNDQMRERHPAVYILASGRHGALYIGVTSDPMVRLHQHRTGMVPGFTSRYGVKRLVYLEEHGDMHAAIAREKQLKAWRRDWKISLIERDNPFWEDLALSLGFPPLSDGRMDADIRQHDAKQRP